jgi:hypothetical protein
VGEITQFVAIVKITSQIRWIFLKVPKCEIFDPFIFTPINPIWVGDLRTGEKKNFFPKTTADIRHFVFVYAG